MIGLSRSHAGDRFYNPPAIRKQQQLQQQQQQQQQQNHKHSKAKSVLSEARETDKRVNDSGLKASVRSLPSASPANNLDRFLEYTTPMVPAQCPPKSGMRGWSTCDPECSPYFCLGDLWESFREWSAYGAGVPLVLDGCDSVVQYYVPYLSGIQLYIDSVKRGISSRRPGEDSDCESSQSSGSNDSDAERQLKILSEGITNHHLSDLRRPSKLLSSRNVTSAGSEGCSFENGESHTSRNIPIFEYLEHDPPYSREPLADKMSSLASKFPKLKTYRSCDLLSWSWFSVAWYPIYRIPTGPTLRDLDACFLTYHRLSTLVKGRNGRMLVRASLAKQLSSPVDISPKLSLPVFGLASYKFKGSAWLPNGTSEHQQEHQRASLLMQAAESWLRVLHVEHPDFKFFISHTTYKR